MHYKNVEPLGYNLTSELFLWVGTTQHFLAKTLISWNQTNFRIIIILFTIIEVRIYKIYLGVLLTLKAPEIKQNIQRRERIIIFYRQLKQHFFTVFSDTD